jgi:hypothetical protein
VHSGKKSGVLQKLLMGKLGLTLHTDMEQQAPPELSLLHMVVELLLLLLLLWPSKELDVPHGH